MISEKACMWIKIDKFIILYWFCTEQKLDGSYGDKGVFITVVVILNEHTSAI